MSAEQLVQKLWNYCNILRDDGLSYGDYVEQLTYLLFLKMADEHSKPPFLHLAPLPAGYNWTSLISKNDEAQLEHYERILRRLGGRKDLFGAIYKNALSKFRDPAKFQRVAAEIDSLEWSKFESDVKGRAYESLLERTAAEGKAGAGQYFTPRPLVDAIAEVTRITPGETICDPACGTGGFLLAAYRQVEAHRLTPIQKKHLTGEAIRGVELVDSVARLCLMNLVLHGIAGQASPVTVTDSLVQPSTEKFDVILANPPFGKKSSVTILSDEGTAPKETLSVSRSDFWVGTSNKQLNFVQHIFSSLKETGRAAVVVPDNVLFEGGPGEIIRRELMKQADLHTLLRLPTGIFYAQGVKANVLFFERKPAQQEPCTTKLWIFDLRTNLHFTLKEKTLKRTDLDEFVGCYSAQNRGNRKPTWSKKTPKGRWRVYEYEELVRRDKASLDIFWLKDESMEDTADLPAPEVIAIEITQDLEAALEHFREIDPDVKV